MAKRPVFIAEAKNDLLFKKITIDFEWFPGFSIKQKQRSVSSLHENTMNQYTDLNILEISSKSPIQLGVDLSAFNLTILTKNNKSFSVETAFQASKVFENGGPFTDLYDKSSLEAKKDKRLKESGRIIEFKYFNRTFPILPTTLFYNWLYINSLFQNKDLASAILEYNAFTDIEFNPARSINCQAEAAAIFISLSKENLIEDALKSVEHFQSIVYPNEHHRNKKIKSDESIEQLKLL